MYWLARYIGTGAEEDPFRPIGTDELSAAGVRWHTIDMRGDCTKVDGWAFLWANGDLPAHPSRIPLGNDPDALLPLATRGAIAVQLGVNKVLPNRLRHILRALLTEHATPDGDHSRWNPVTPEPGSNRYQIMLGTHYDEFV